ncbi:F-box/LRR-repeat protein At4g14103-like [Cornus florida]|uniref:F-box/LRR-repeat protein At4g14103-like n=1 Tax=Cornus florida TaxID=4283 RepID=UPI0028A0C28D|nr:F-box/LRR-repeat protein At4g14103-like [Cornus florida]
MDPISKRQKPLEESKKMEESEEEEDRLSRLPSSIIGHILSFLPTKQAMATSVLSTKWKHLWKSISNLDFDDWFVTKHPHNISTTRSVRSFEKKLFIDFVYQVLLLRNVWDMNKFRLKYINKSSASHINAWVATALSRKVRELDLFINNADGNILRLPGDLFISTTLVLLSLRLTTRVSLNVPNLVSLNSLKILHLHSVGFSDEDTLHRLISSCHVLDDLSIQDCLWRNTGVVNISSSSLKSLIMKTMFIDDKCKIVLNTPNLQHLVYHNLLKGGYLWDNLNSLVKASIRLTLYSTAKARDRVVKLAVSQLVEGVSGVQRLYLNGDSMEAVQLWCCSLPEFHNLTYLELGHIKGVSWKLLPDLLGTSRQLQTLVFEDLSTVGDENHQLHWYPPEKVPSCLLLHLKVIEIRKFRGERDELKLAKYFLKNANVLKKLIIHPTVSKESEVCKELLMLPRGSKTCQVDFI